MLFRSVEKREAIVSVQVEEADPPEFIAAARYGAEFVSGNPRRIKRYLNSFRFFSHIETRRQGAIVSTRSHEWLAVIAAASVEEPRLLKLWMDGKLDAGGGSVMQAVESNDAEQLSQFGLKPTEALERRRSLALRLAGAPATEYRVFAFAADSQTTA